jgi:ParB-like chromosome segregation protein Spo0J
MQLEHLPISTLKPAPYNPRVALRPGDPRWERLQRSIREFDLVQPVVWNRRTGHVVAGHQRLAVLRADGHEQVDCIVVDLALEREQALNVALNNPEVGGEWDPDLLSGLLEDLADLPEFDATLTGFDEQQLSDLMLIPAEQATLPTDDEPEAAVIAVTLDVPPDQWPAVETRLNELLAAQPGVRLHVKWPHP